MYLKTYKILIYTIIKDVLDHLSVLKVVDVSGFVSNTKHFIKFLHRFHNFQLIFYNTNQLISNKISKGNCLVVWVYPMVNFVMDLSTYAYRQKDSKLFSFVFQLIIIVCLNELNKLLHLFFRT